ncbi:MAG: L,D-transpeptidase family protein [Steroidobacteraceae bacterium]|jgi:murein L,D-transpeptidase YafK
MRRILSALLPVLIGVSGGAWPGIGLTDDSAAAAAASAYSIVGASLGAQSAQSAPAAAPLSLNAQMPVADQIVVRKSERRLYLMRHGEVLREYHVALGLMPEGPKERAGDFRTPEGHYQLTRRNPRSDYFLSIQVSYPNDADVRRARRQRVDPGGAIMVHGWPNSLRHNAEYYASSDWTDGCIGMSNSDMVELWMMTQDNIPIEILP